jgi:hypothetical protein
MEEIPKQKVVNIGKYRLEQLKSDKTSDQLSQEVVNLTVAKNGIKSLFETKEPSIEDFPVTNETTLKDLPSVPLLGRSWRETIEILLEYFDSDTLIRDLPTRIKERIQKDKKILDNRYKKESK